MDAEQIAMEAIKTAQGVPTTPTQKDSSSLNLVTLDKWMKNAGYPRRHIKMIPKMTGPSLEEAKKRTERILRGDCIFLLSGDRGPGKTQMAAFWGQQCLLEEKSTRYHKAHSFLCTIRDQFGNNEHRAETAREILQRAKKVHLLVIDECSELAGTDWEKRTMTEIIDERYDNELSTVIITNHAPKEAVKEVGPSIWSRAEETGGIVVCDWESYRNAKDE